MRVHAGEDFGKFLVVIRLRLFAVLAPFGEEDFHALETGFVQGIQHIERSKDERSRAPSGVQHSNSGNGLPEGHEQVRAFAILDNVLRILAQV